MERKFLWFRKGGVTYENEDNLLIEVRPLYEDDLLMEALNSSIVIGLNILVKDADIDARERDILSVELRLQHSILGIGDIRLDEASEGIVLSESSMFITIFELELLSKLRKKGLILITTLLVLYLAFMYRFTAFF